MAQRRSVHLSGLLAGLWLLVTCAGTIAGAASFPPPVITNASLTGGEVRLDWREGRPSYQIQSAPDPRGPWSNVGSPTTNTFALLSAAGSQGFYRVASDYTAQFKVVFDASWSQATHPSNWPANPHFSGLVGGTHNASVHFYRTGETASEGIRLMAELGQKTTLLSEVAAAATNAHLQLSGGGINPSPGSVTLTFPAPMRRDFPLVTLVSMIAPSPDWFVGVDSLSLIENGEWVSNKVVTLYGMDAGTDSGASYSSADLVTVPRGVVTEFTDFPALVNGQIVPFGTYTFTRLD